MTTVPQSIRSVAAPLCCLFAAVFLVPALQAETIIKASSGTLLSDGASWTGGLAPGAGDQASWNAGSAVGTLNLGADLTWAGIAVSNTATGSLTLTNAVGMVNTLCLGSNGVTFALTSKSFNFYSPIILTTNQTWTFGSSDGLGTFGNLSGTNVTLTLSGSSGSYWNPRSSGSNFRGTINYGFASRLQFQANFGSWGNAAINLSAATGLQANGLNGTVVLGDLSTTYTGATVGGAGVNAQNGTVTYQVGALGNNSTFAGAITDGSGPTSLNKVGSGTWTLSGNNSFTGTTTVSGGALKILSANALGASGTSANATTVSAGARLEVDGGVAIGNESLTLSGNGGGSGALRSLSGNNSWGVPGAGQQLVLGGDTTIQVDGGQLVLYGANSYGGLFNASSYTLTKSGDGELALTNNGGVVVLKSLAVAAGTLRNLSANGNMDLQPSSGTPALTLSEGTLVTGRSSVGIYNNGGVSYLGTAAGASVDRPLILVKTGNHTINVADGAAVNDLVLSGAISQVAAGAALVKSGAGLLVLSGSSSYSGGTTVSAGTLWANNTSGSATGSGLVDVQPGATLGGVGAISGLVTVESGAVLAPGTNSIGVLTLSQSPVLQGEVTMQLDRNATRKCDSLAISGALTYGGALMVTNSGAPLQAGDTFTLFTATSYAGAFSTITLPPLASGLMWNTAALAQNGSLSVIANYPPAASAIGMGAISGQPARLQIIGGKHSPTDPDNDPLTLSAVQNPSAMGGTVLTDGTNVVYTSANTFAGTDTFNYTVSDGRGGIATSTVTVSVAASSQSLNRISGPVLTNAVLRLTFVGIPSYQYALETATNLAAPVWWTSAVTNTADEAGRLLFELDPTNNGAYFRTRAVP